MLMRTAEEEQKEDEACDLLVSMMGDTADPEVARRLLRKFNGDIQRAADAILSNEILDDNDPYWTPVSSSQQPLPSTSVIDLTADDDYRQGRPLTRERSEASVRVRAEPPSNRTIKFAPTDRAPDPNWQMVPANVEVEMGHDDQTLKRAIEASLNDFVVNDDADPFPYDETIREGGRPIAIHAERQGFAYAGLVLQALFYIPQVRRAVAALHMGNEAEPPEEIEKRTLWHLAELFTNMDLAQLGVIVDKEVAPLVTRGPWTGNQEQLGNLASEMVTGLGREIENYLYMSDGSRPHIFFFTHGSAEFRESPQARIRKNPGDGCVVSVDISTPGLTDLVSRLSHSLSRYFEGGSTHEVIVDPSDLAIFKPQLGDKPPSYSGTPSSPEPLVYPKILYLDRFLSCSAVLVESKRREESKLLTEVDALKLQRRSLTGYNNRDSIKDLKTSIHYYEHVAGPRDVPERLATINATTAKLKNILSTIEQKVQGMIGELEADIAVIFDCPELKQHRYDLRAVLFHTGVPGRKHIYSYVQDEHGIWWKTIDGTVTEVPEDVVLNDTTGLHLGAGPFMILYSKHMTEEEIRAPVPWPQRLVDFVQQHNDTFLSMLPPELAAKAQANAPPRSHA